MKSMNLEMFESAQSFRRGASAVGVRADLQTAQIPLEVKALLNLKKQQKTK